MHQSTICFIPRMEVSVMKFGWFLEPNTMFNDSGLYQGTVWRYWRYVRAKHEAGMVQENKTLHSTPTFCVKKPQGNWRIVHACDKLNAATISAQILIPRKDVLRNNMVGCTMCSAFDLVDGYYQLPCELAIFCLQRLAPQAVCYGSGGLCHKGFQCPGNI